jgi:hypothetical protein
MARQNETMYDDVNEIKKQNRRGDNNKQPVRATTTTTIQCKKTSTGTHNEMNRRGKKRPMIYSADWTQVTKFSFILCPPKIKKRTKLKTKRKSERSERPDEVEYTAIRIKLFIRYCVYYIRG